MSNKKPKRKSLDGDLSPVEYNLNTPTMYRLVYNNAISPKGDQDEIVPKLIRDFIPMSVIQSFSIALDPFYKFKATSVHIAPVSRTRKRIIRSVLGDRKTVLKSTATTTAKTWSFGNNCKGDVAVSSDAHQEVLVLPHSNDYWKEVKDTTTRTRPAGFAFGEYESKEYNTHSPSRQVRREDNLHIYGPSTCPNMANTSFGEGRSWSENIGDGGSIDQTTLETHLESERTALLGIMQGKILGMLPKVLPERRHFSFFREAGELRDVAKSYNQLRSTLGHFGNTVAAKFSKAGARRYIYNRNALLRDIPKEYVGYHFGWKQLFKAWVDLSQAPAKITRDMNKLIERRGKPTTFRLTQKYAIDGLTSPGFTYPNYTSGICNIDERHDSLATEIARNVELRLMVNAVFDFPTVGVPEFRQELVAKKFGILPTPIDLYNLTPWSWLVDWFTGLGNYLEAIQAINTDRSTFNYGFLTGRLVGRVKTVLTSHTADHNQIIFLAPFPPSNSDLWTENKAPAHTSLCEYKVTVRKDIVAAYGAKSLVSGGLSGYQKSILGAILIDRHLSRNRGKRPRI